MVNERTRLKEAMVKVCRTYIHFVWSLRGVYHSVVHVISRARLDLVARRVSTRVPCIQLCTRLRWSCLDTWRSWRPLRIPSTARRPSYRYVYLPEIMG